MLALHELFFVDNRGRIANTTKGSVSAFFIPWSCENDDRVACEVEDSCKSELGQRVGSRRTAAGGADSRSTVIGTDDNLVSWCEGQRCRSGK